MAIFGKCHWCTELRDLTEVRYSGGLRLCRSCYFMRRYYDQRKWKNCSVCGEKKPIQLKPKKNEAICYKCYQSHFRKKGECENCGKIAFLSEYRGNGKKMCHGCRSKERYHDETLFEKCWSCKLKKPVAARDAEGFPICYNCVKKGKHKK